MTNVIEMDIHYLTGQKIDLLPVRFRKTVRFQDQNNRLTQLTDKLQRLHSLESKLRKWPSPTGFAGFFHSWRINLIRKRIFRLENKLERKAEKLLRRELDSSRDMSMLVRGECDKYEFVPMGKGERYQIIGILCNDYRLLHDDWVFISTRILGPKKDVVLAII